MAKTYIIAEVGSNHNGSFDLAKKYLEELKESGVDAIKFQLCDPNKLLSLELKDKLTEVRERQLSREHHKKLKKLCDNMHIDYLCSAFDLESLKFLNEEINIKKFKIPSGEIFSLDILDYISKKNKPIILSTGMATLDDIQKSLTYLNNGADKDITILHCVSNYPTETENVNLKIMLELKKKFKYKVGFSDHTESNYSSLTAVAMGASIIEKHVTLDKELKGPDHKSSSTIDEFKDLVKLIRKTEAIMGVSDKKISKKEKEVSDFARKSIVAKNKILQGQIIKEKDIVFKRPGTGILPIEKGTVIGKKAVKKIDANKLIKKEYLES